MNRRSLLGGMLAACAAPAIVRASSLMRTPKVPPDLEMMSCTMTLNRFGEMEIGRVENFRFIVSDPLPVDGGLEWLRFTPYASRKIVVANHFLL